MLDDNLILVHLKTLEQHASLLYDFYSEYTDSDAFRCTSAHKFYRIDENLDFKAAIENFAKLKDQTLTN